MYLTLAKNTKRIDAVDIDLKNHNESKEIIFDKISNPWFIPETTNLLEQLVEFKKRKENALRIALHWESHTKQKIEKLLMNSVTSNLIFGLELVEQDLDVALLL